MLPESLTVDEAAARRRLSILPGEVCGKRSERSNPHRKVEAELAEVSSTHSTEEKANHQEGKG